jgi:hypothetical protein
MVSKFWNSCESSSPESRESWHGIPNSRILRLAIAHHGTKRTDASTWPNRKKTGGSVFSILMTSGSVLRSSRATRNPKESDELGVHGMMGSIKM